MIIFSIFQFIRKMDYFGISSPNFERKLKIFQENKERKEKEEREEKEEKEEKEREREREREENVFVGENCGFGCQSENCKNREARYGTLFLPYCNEKCMKKNLEFLISENLRYKGEINAYEKILIKDQKNGNISPKRKREDLTIRKDHTPNPKKLSYSP